MSTARNLLSMFISAASMTAMLPASASDYITRSTTYVTPSETLQIVPQSMFIPVSVSPTQTVKTTKTTVTTTTPAFIQPTIVRTPDTVTRSVIMMGSTPAASSSSTITTAEVGPFPVYRNRLSAMNEQIDRSLANGWITQNQADHLRLESNRLSQLIMNRDTLATNTEMLEKGLTGLNLSIQSAMQATGHTAAITPSTY